MLDYKFYLICYTIQCAIHLTLYHAAHVFSFSFLLYMGAMVF